MSATDVLQGVFSLGADQVIQAGSGKTPGEWIGTIFDSHVGGKNLDATQADFARELLRVSRPARSRYFQQLGEALRTGQATGRIDQTQYQVQGARADASTARQQALEGLAAANLNQGTNTGKMGKLAAVEGAGAIKGALTPSDVLMQYVLSAPGAVLGQAQQQVVSPLSGLAQIEANKYLTNLEAQTTAFSGIGNALGQILGHYTPVPGASPSASPGFAAAQAGLT